MIQSKVEYMDYIAADASANHFSPGLSGFINVQKKYLRWLRKAEYLENCYGNKVSILWARYRLYKLSIKIGYSIPINTFGKGLCLPHRGTIIVNGSARFGEDCMVQCGVNISERVIGGNHLFLGTRCKLMISVRIADDVIVDANAVVTKNFDEANCVLAGVPAIRISENGNCNRKDI